MQENGRLQKIVGRNPSSPALSVAMSTQHRNRSDFFQNSSMTTYAWDNITINDSLKVYSEYFVSNN